MLLHMDGSPHQWVPQLKGAQTLLVIMDDATSRVYQARLIPQETTWEVLAMLQEVVEHQGIFCSLYTDRASHFITTRQGKGPHRAQQASGPTQVERALGELGIQLITALSPQARGRMERLFGTWQGRLPQELRLRGIGDYGAANRFLQRIWVPYHNRTWIVSPEQSGSAFIPCHRPDLDRIFALKQERTVAQDNTVQYGRLVLQIEPNHLRANFARCRVTVYQHLDETISIGFGPHTLGRYNAKGEHLKHKGDSHLSLNTKNRTNHLLQKADIFTC